MAIHFVIGYKDLGGSAEVEPVYCGRDAEEARKAIERYQGAATRWVRNPRGLYKVSPAVATAKQQAKNQAALEQSPVVAPDPEAVAAAELQAKLDRLDELEKENAELKEILDADTPQEPEKEPEKKEDEPEDLLSPSPKKKAAKTKKAGPKSGPAGSSPSAGSSDS